MEIARRKSLKSEPDDNRVVLEGLLTRKPDTRENPAGIPISRFTLRHESQQVEAGLTRQAVCTIHVVAAGAELQAAVRQLREGSRVRVAGFLSRTDNRQGEYRIVIHARLLDLLSDNGSNEQHKQ